MGRKHTASVSRRTRAEHGHDEPVLEIPFQI